MGIEYLLLESTRDHHLAVPRYSRVEEWRRKERRSCRSIPSSTRKAKHLIGLCANYTNADRNKQKLTEWCRTAQTERDRK